MKKFYIFIPLIAALISCENKIDYVPKNTDQLLIMNTIMNANNTEHAIMLSISKTYTVKDIANGEIKCFVNNELKATSSTSNITAPNEIKGILDFNANFKAGDIVRIEAKANNNSFNVRSEIKIPEKVKITKVDTMSVMKGRTSEQMEFKVSMKDLSAAKEYYCINLIYNYKLKYLKNNTVIKECEGKKILKIDSSEDPVISSGDKRYFLNQNGKKSELKTPSNVNYFFDKMFNGKDVTLKIYIYKNQLLHFDKENIDPTTYDEQILERSIDTELSAINYDMYNYLNAMYLLHNSPFSNTPFSEPIKIPTNVHGGLGFISIINPATVHIELKPLRIYKK